MSTVNFIANAKSVKELDTFTPANIAGGTFILTCNGKTLSYVAVGATVAEVTAGVVALVTAAVDGEWRKVVAADGTTVMTLTGVDYGVPFTVTSSATGGTATFVRVATTAWSGGRCTGRRSRRPARRTDRRT